MTTLKPSKTRLKSLSMKLTRNVKINIYNDWVKHSGAVNHLSNEQIAAKHNITEAQLDKIVNDGLAHNDK